MEDTFGFELRTKRRPPYEPCVDFRYVSKDGLEIINATGREAERLYEEVRARGSVTYPSFRLRPRMLRGSS